MPPNCLFLTAHVGVTIGIQLPAHDQVVHQVLLTFNKSEGVESSIHIILQQCRGKENRQLFDWTVD